MKTTIVKKVISSIKDVYANFNAQVNRRANESKAARIWRREVLKHLMTAKTEKERRQAETELAMFVEAYKHDVDIEEVTFDDEGRVVHFKINCA